MIVWLRNLSIGELYTAPSGTSTRSGPLKVYITLGQTQISDLGTRSYLTVCAESALASGWLTEQVSPICRHRLTYPWNPHHGQAWWKPGLFPPFAVSIMSNRLFSFSRAMYLMKKSVLQRCTLSNYFRNLYSNVVNKHSSWDGLKSGATIYLQPINSCGKIFLF